MPSETMGFKSLSSSLFSFEDICSSTKKQDGFWKSDNWISDCYENSIVDVIATQHESSLFSSSLSELFSRKLRLSANNALYGHSVDNAASQSDEEDMLFESLEELEAQTIGNLLPNDDDDLLTGLTDGLDDHIVRDSATVDLDELDIFASVGGMDLGDNDDNPSSGTKNSEFVVGTCNSQQELCNASIAGEHFSRTLHVENIHPELEQKEFSCRLHQKSPPLNSPTSRPATCAPCSEASFLHGVSSSVPNSLPSGPKVKSVGNQCPITEFGSPRELSFGIQGSSAFDTHSLPECHDGLANVFLPNPPELAAYINYKTQERIDNMQYCQANYNGHAMEFNEYAFKSYGNGICVLPGHHYKWRNSHHTRGMKWSNSASYFNGIYAGPSLPRLRGVPRSPSHMMRPVLSMSNYHMSSAPSVNCNIWDIQPAYATHCVDLTSHDNFPHFGRNYADLQFLPKNVGLQFQNQRGMMFPQKNHMIPMINSFGTHKEHARGRRNVAGSNLVDKKQYELDIDCIKKGEDNRTTLMIKNIPNKYTSKMLLAAIDEHHKGTYDFIYLPIDFKNKCNVGYAFINMTDPSLIIPFYQVFNGKKWEKFNSEKVATLAYARIQGKEALIAHFQNSSLMNEDKRCRPILFSTDGPNAGDQVPFPIGVNIRNKPGRSRNNILEDKLTVSPPYPGTGRLSPGGDCDSKDSN